MSLADTAGERTLWAAVLQTALEDAAGRPTATGPAGRAAVIDDAHRWLARGGPDFRIVCWLAGVDPEFIQRRSVAA